MLAVGELTIELYSQICGMTLVWLQRSLDRDFQLSVNFPGVEMESGRCSLCLILSFSLHCSKKAEMFIMCDSISLYAVVSGALDNASKRALTMSSLLIY